MRFLYDFKQFRKIQIIFIGFIYNAIQPALYGNHIVDLIVQQTERVAFPKIPCLHLSSGSFDSGSGSRSSDSHIGRKSSWV